MDAAAATGSGAAAWPASEPATAMRVRLAIVHTPTITAITMSVVRPHRRRGGRGSMRVGSITSPPYGRRTARVCGQTTILIELSSRAPGLTARSGWQDSSLHCAVNFHVDGMRSGSRRQTARTVSSVGGVSTAPKPGEALPLPGMHVTLAVREWALQKLSDNLRATNQGTGIIGDFDLDSITVHFRPHGDVAEVPDDYVALVIDADTEHGGHFHYVIPWNPCFAIGTMVQIVQAAGGVVHA